MYSDTQYNVGARSVGGQKVLVLSLQGAELCTYVFLYVESLFCYFNVNIMYKRCYI